MKYFISTVIGVVVLAIIFGFTKVGSPANQRLRRSDDVRLGHLQQIQGNVLSYWQAKETVPNNLDELNDTLRDVNVPVDPETGAPYTYEKKTDTSFKLCSNFHFSSAEAEPGISGPKYYPAEPMGAFGSTDSSWKHTAGMSCFERTIDKDFFSKRPVL